jgi:hypothetical protein
MIERMAVEAEDQSVKCQNIRPNIFYLRHSPGRKEPVATCKAKKWNHLRYCTARSNGDLHVHINAMQGPWGRSLYHSNFFVCIPKGSGIDT